MSAKERNSNSWDALANTWEEDGNARKYSELAFRSLQPYIRTVSGDSSRVLDFGSGTGLLSERLAPLVGEVVAVDTSSKMLDVLKAKQLDNVTTLCLELDSREARTHPVLAPGFDLVVASSVCAFVSELQATMLAIATVMKPECTFVHWDWERDKDDAGPGFSKEHLRRAYAAVKSLEVTLETAFSIVMDGREMNVVMGVAKKAL